MKLFLWYLMELAINFYQAGIATYLCYAYLGDKKDRPFLKSPAIWCVLAITAEISMASYLLTFENLWAIIYAITSLIYSLVCLKQSIWQKMFISLYSLFLITLTSATIGSLMSALYREDFFVTMQQPGVERFTILMVVQLSLFYLTRLSLRIFKPKKKAVQLKSGEWLLILTILLITFCVGAIAVYALPMTIKTTPLYSGLIMCGLVLINIVTVSLALQLNRKNEELKEMEILKLTKEYNDRYIESASAEYDAIRKLRHDMKNSFNVISKLIEEGNSQKALEYISDNMEILSKSGVHINTTNQVLNAIVNSKISEAKSFGIETSCICPEDISGIENVDLLRLVSNMLENAIQYCKKSNLEHRYISFSVFRDESGYTFSVKNSTDGKVMEKNPDLLSDKRGRKEKGLGLEIINDIAAKYNGHADFHELDNEFCSMAIIYV